MDMDRNCNSTKSEKAWFAVKVRERFERTVSRTIESKDIETFLPVYSVPSRRTDRTKMLEAPLFPGYAFCRIDPTCRLPILTIPGVQHFVGFGRFPSPIPDSEIESLRILARSRIAGSPGPCISRGERVRVEVGPLRGMEGVLLAFGKHLHQLVVCVELLQRSVAVTVDRDAVVPLDAPRRDIRPPDFEVRLEL